MATTLTLPPLRPEIATYPIEHSHPPTDAAESSAPSQPGKNEPQTQADSTSQSVAALHDQLHASHLTSSPYPEIENQLHLQDLDTPHKLFALALTTLRPIRDDYATAPYLESFNWSDVFATLRELCRLVGQNWPELGFYIVIFRSKLHADIDRERLGLLDRKSHAEACASGGLLKYWFGSCDVERRNLATCLWRNRQDAADGGGGPWHKQARAAARDMYESITFYTHRLIVEEGAENWRLEAYE